MRLHIAVLLGAGFLAASAASVSAQTLPPQERLCDPTFEDCRADILTYIQQETVGIDIAYWMMTDARYSNALVEAWQRGVRIRALMDPRCKDQHPACVQQNDQLEQAGIPMRKRNTNGILHWKAIIFAGQGQVEFSGANFAPYELSPEAPWVDFTDELAMFTKEPALVQSFMTKFDDMWISSTEFVDYANITAPLARRYPQYPIDPRLNFPPDDSYRARSTAAYAQEQQGIDVDMFRITDERQTDAVIAAKNRGVPVRLITDSTEYRNPLRLWHAYNVDKMWYAGVQVRFDAHQGINHEKAVLLRGQGMSIFGSSNWTTPSSDSQREHNLFTTQAWIYTWLEDQFTRKWTNGSGHSETGPFTPLPPDVPKYNFPDNGATDVAAASPVSLTWNAGLWAHNYDIYFGVTPNPPLLESNKRLGPSQYDTDYRYYALPPLQPGTRYYWKIVSKTMAYVTAEGPVWSFTTAGAPSGSAAPSVTITSPASGATFAAQANVTITASASDSDGSVAKVDFYAGNTRIGTAAAAPYSVTWTNVPAGQYSLSAVATDNTNVIGTSAPVSITVGSGPSPPPPPPSSLPSGWSHADIGATGATGDTTYGNGTFSVTGAGADVWGTSDAFQFAWQSLTGDGTIVARVATIQDVNAWTKAGVMMRSSTSPSAAYAFMIVAGSSARSGQSGPRWVKLVRAGTTISGYDSWDGTTWSLVGSDTFAIDSTLLVGLAVSSHVAGTNATATFDNVAITPGGGTSQRPSVSLTSPMNRASYTAPATIRLEASANDPDGAVAKVDFYAGTTLLGTSTTAPYGLTWNNVPAGDYSLTAVATGNRGLKTTSTAVTVTVNPAGGSPSGGHVIDIGNVPFGGYAGYAGRSTLPATFVLVAPSKGVVFQRRTATDGVSK